MSYIYICVQYIVVLNVLNFDDDVLGLYIYKYINITQLLYVCMQ